MLRRISIAALLFAAACSEEEPGRNPITPSPDAGQVVPDAGDAGGEAADTGVPVVEDGGMMTEPDAGMPATVSPVESVTVGTVTVDAMGDSEVFNFELPDDVTSFSILLKGVEEATYIVKKLDSPLGNLVTDDPSNVTPIEMFLLGPFAAQFKSPNRAVQDRGVAAASFPNNPAVTVTGGMYSLVVSAVIISGNQAMPAPGPVEVIVQYRKERVASGKLDVSLYFTGAGNLMSTTAPTDPLIMEALDHLRMIYGTANVEIGAVTYYDVDPGFQTIEGVDGSGDDLEQMFKLTEGHGPGLHYFFVDRFEAGMLPGANIAGISGGLPGPALLPGSVNSGVAVALTTVMGDAGVLAHVMAHEGGHWLGLFHTSEIIGTEDQMPDTPSGQAGNTFLMYPAVGGGTTISANQAAVLRQHPEVIGLTAE